MYSLRRSIACRALGSIYVYRVTENGKTTLTGKVVKE